MSESVLDLGSLNTLTSFPFMGLAPDVTNKSMCLECNQQWQPWPSFGPCLGPVPGLELGQKLFLAGTVPGWNSLSHEQFQLGTLPVSTVSAKDSFTQEQFQPRTVSARNMSSQEQFQPGKLPVKVTQYSGSGSWPKKVFKI